MVNLLALGTAMAMAYGGVIILGFYGVYFLLALPLVRLRRLAKPVIAVGSMSLTACVGHFVVQSVLPPPDTTGTQQSWMPLLLFILGATLFAGIWSRFFRRGPLEYLLNAATKPAKHIR